MNLKYKIKNSRTLDMVTNMINTTGTAPAPAPAGGAAAGNAPRLSGNMQGSDHCDSDVDSIENAVNALANKSFVAQNKPLSDGMKDRVLKPFAVSCQLDASTAFDILDAYFLSNQGKLIHFETVNIRM